MCIRDRFLKERTGATDDNGWDYDTDNVPSYFSRETDNKPAKAVLISANEGIKIKSPEKQ